MQAGGPACSSIAIRANFVPLTPEHEAMAAFWSTIDRRPAGHEVAAQQLEGALAIDLLQHDGGAIQSLER